MIFLPEIVQFVNEAIKTRLTPYPTARITGLTYPVTMIRGENTQITVPAILYRNDAELIVNDDRFPFTLFHRAISATNSARESDSYGDGDPRYVTGYAEIELVLVGFRDKIRISPEQFAAVVGDSIPARISMVIQELNIPAITINWNSIQFDQRSVWNTVFPGLQYNLSINEFMVSLRYRIEISYMQGCLTTCEC